MPNVAVIRRFYKTHFITKMIPNKGREARNTKSAKASRNIERLYKQAKCRECSVVVTRMDFHKILGKFTKVKIQYENVTETKSRGNKNQSLANSNNRLKSRENGTLIVHKNAYNKCTAKILNNNSADSPKRNNILKENNRLKKTPILKGQKVNFDNQKPLLYGLKQYGIVFLTPVNNNNHSELKTKLSLAELLPIIDERILPSTDWCIDYFPKSEEPKDDKVYDRIAAELEDLMYNEKSEKTKDTIGSKSDDFPSIMDILNDNSSENISKDNQNTSSEVKTDLKSTDVEAMLLGKQNESDEGIAPVNVDTAEINNMHNDNQKEGLEKNLQEKMDVDENPRSPSILDETLQKGIEEHLPSERPVKDAKETNVHDILKKHSDGTKEDQCGAGFNTNKTQSADSKQTELKSPLKQESKHESIHLTATESITHVIFKKTVDGKCIKSVTCPKSLKYSIELKGRAVELIGAPKYISNLDDLNVLLQIVNESDLNSLHVTQ